MVSGAIKKAVKNLRRVDLFNKYEMYHFYHKVNMLCVSDGSENHYTRSVYR